MTRFVSEIERELQDHYRPDRQTSLTVSLPQGLAEKLAGVARGLGYTTTRFAAQLLTAAYSARYGIRSKDIVDRPANSRLASTYQGAK
jgi:hypothetical protein